MSGTEFTSHDFSSLNPYGNIVAVKADDPEELARILTEIKAPFKILGFVSFGIKQVCYISTANLKVKKSTKQK